MNSSKSTYDFRLIIVSMVGVVALAVAFFFYWDMTKFVIRQILESQLTYFLIWTITVLIFIVHYIKHKDKDVRSETILTKKFGVFFDNALGGIAYGTSMTTALTLLKGIYIQKCFEDKVFFLEFNDLDLTTVFGVMFFLLYYSTMKVIDIAKETYKIQHTEQVLTENKIVVVPNENDDTNLNTIHNPAPKR